MAVEQEIASRLILPMDYQEGIHCAAAQELLGGVEDSGVVIKIGTVTTVQTGWIDPLREAGEHGLHTFADTKAADTHNTVRDTLDAIMDENPLLVNMHAEASDAALEAFVTMAQEKKAKIGEGAGLITLAVTVLTDTKEEQVKREYGRTREEEVLRRARKAREFGFDGVVCSAEELEALAADPDTAEMEKVVAAIRPLWSVADGQQNIVTPREAMLRGATRIVCGSPITRQYRSIGDTQLDAVEAVLQELKEAV